MGGKRPYLLEGERSFLLGRLAEKPDLTLHALLSELRERGVAVSCDTVWRFLRRTGVSFKKNAFRQRARSPDVARRRTLGKKIPLRRDPRRLIFIDQTIDETWAILRQAQDQYDAHTWLEQTRRGAHRQRAAGSLKNDDIPRRLAM